MQSLRSGRFWWPFLITITCLTVQAVPAAADWFGNYFNTILGTRWVHENVDFPGITVKDTVFEYIEYEGHPAVRLGQGMENHSVVNNTGRIVTVFAQVDDGVLFDFPEDFVLGEFFDGSLFSYCPEGADCDSSLIRIWTDLDPGLRSIYGMNPAVTDLVLIASYDRDFDKNLNNTVIESNLPVGLEPPAGAVTGIEWYQWKVGLYAELGIDAASGGFGDYYRLVEHTSAVDQDSWPPPLAVLEQNYPNPFNPLTTITYDLRQPSVVSLRIVNCAGHLVRTLEPATQQAAGRYSLHWDGRDNLGRMLPSGTYLYKLKTGSVVQARSMVLVR